MYGSRETTASITEWATSTFGDTGGHARRAARANEEMSELLRAAVSQDPPERQVEEAADVAIVLHLFAGRHGFDLDEAIARKMCKNRARQWTIDATGCGYHVKPASGMEAPSGGETAQTGSTEGDSPTGEAGDAQPPPSR